jgi:putative peptide zinc metalloprotease protein
MAWPALRDELALLPGAPLADGQPSHTLHDPSRNRYFQIDWATFEILRRWPLSDADAIAAAVARETTLRLDADDVAAVLRFLDANELLRSPPGGAADLARRLGARHGSTAQWLLHNYLFFRIPLIRPDRWLARWAPSLGFFHSRLFAWLTGGALALGTLAIYRQWDVFAATLVDTLSWTGMASYALALTGVKTLHEFAHALTAKRHGCRVPTMGIAFLVMWPVAYTDTNDVWRLTRRRQRLAVAAAGIVCELAVAAWASLAWALLPDGGARQVAFLLATTTWVSTLAINLSPFMRFDGYFLLADALSLPNLHARAFALARWDLRERLFALREPAPERFAPRRRAGLIAFAYATWIYRLLVFLGIATMVYAFFIKAVGILLFLVEIVWFVLLPFINEGRAWAARWPALRASRRARRTFALALGALLLFSLPLPTRFSASALLRPVDQFVVYAPPHARVAALPIADGAHVTAGAPLLQLDSPELASRRAAALARHERLRWQAGVGALDSEQRAQWSLARENLASADAELASLAAEAARYAPVAPYAGVLRFDDPDLAVGNWLAAQEPLAHLIADGERQVIAYLDDHAVNGIAVDDTATFYADGADGPVVALKVAGIDRDSSRTLQEPELSTLFGGDIEVREKHGALYPERAIYRVTLRAVRPTPSANVTQRVWRGRVVICGRWSVPARRYLQSALSVFWREAGF